MGGYFTGLQKFTYWVMASDKTYGSANPVNGAVQATGTANTATGSLYADNKKAATATKLTSKTVELVLASLPLEDQANLLGHTYNAGTVIVSETDVAPYVAIAYERTKDNGDRELKVFYKGRFSEGAENSQTGNDGINYETQSISGEFIYDDDGDLEYKLDTGATGVDPTTISDWYTTPQKP